MGPNTCLFMKERLIQENKTCLTEKVALFVNKKNYSFWIIRVVRSNTALVMIKGAPCKECEAYNLSSAFPSKVAINLHQAPASHVPPTKVGEISLLCVKK